MLPGLAAAWRWSGPRTAQPVATNCYGHQTRAGQGTSLGAREVERKQSVCCSTGGDSLLDSVDSASAEVLTTVRPTRDTTWRLPPSKRQHANGNHF